jgi:hypothetical protein
LNIDTPQLVTICGSFHVVVKNVLKWQRNNNLRCCQRKHILLTGYITSQQ